MVLVLVRSVTGPMRVAKRAMLNREGANEGTWMKVMAERSRDANSDWTKGRLEALSPLGGLLSLEREKVREDAMDVDGAGVKACRGGTSSQYPVGMYELHSGIVHCEFTILTCIFVGTNTYASQTVQTLSQLALTGNPHLQLENGEESLGGRKSGTVHERWHGRTLSWKCQRRARQTSMRGVGSRCGRRLGWRDLFDHFHDGLHDDAETFVMYGNGY